MVLTQETRQQTMQALARYLQLPHPTPDQQQMLREQLPQDLTQTPVRKRLSEAAQQLRLGPACLARLTALQLPDTLRVGTRSAGLPICS